MSTSRAVSLALAAAAGLHLAALPDHAEEGALIAGFFLACAILQLVAAVVVGAGAGPGARRVIVAGNLVVVAIWLVSRTVGLPFGPDAGAPEAVSTLDALSVAAEIMAIGGLAVMGRKRRRPARAWHPGPVAALALTSLLVAGAGVAFATPHEHSAGAHHHDEPAAEHHHHGH